jgi:hypothetical protein
MYNNQLPISIIFKKKKLLKWVYQTIVRKVLQVTYKL